MSERQIDAALIDACRTGDRAAFQALFEAYKDKVYSIAYHFSGNPDTASDITQQAFLKILTRIETFRSQSELTTWIYRIVANTCIDERRIRRRFIPLGDGLDLRTLTAKGLPDKGYYREELSAAVSQAVAGLKPKLRMPILLKYVEDMSYEEIAQVLGCSMGTVASRLNRGHKMLASKLAHLKGALNAGNEDV
ncbi:MAG TPA: sigma-70 family RNA polymerase sigma factor [Blastocatellia bacterium]